MRIAFLLVLGSVLVGAPARAALYFWEDAPADGPTNPFPERCVAYSLTDTRPARQRRLYVAETPQEAAEFVALGLQPARSAHLTVEVRRRGALRDGTFRVTFEGRVERAVDAEDAAGTRLLRSEWLELSSPWSWMSRQHATNLHAPAFTPYSRWFDLERSYRVMVSVQLNLQTPDGAVVQFATRLYEAPSRDTNGKSMACARLVVE